MSFLETYRAKKQLLVQKLNNKGVQANTNEGFSTLADKITDINDEVIGKYSKTVTLTWDDNNNSKSVRPESVQIFLLHEGEKAGTAILNPLNNWSYTFTELLYNSGYSIEGQDVENYTTTTNNLNITYSIDTGHLRLNVNVSGYPEGYDLSALSMIVSGADPTMPLTIGYSQLTNGQYDFGQILTGAYLIRATNATDLIEEYYIDTNYSNHISDAVQLNNGMTQTLNLNIVYCPPEGEIIYDENPSENFSQLNFEIIGADSRMPMSVYYNEFSGAGNYTINLQPGTYAVVARNAIDLIEGYNLQSGSVDGMSLVVEDDGSSTAALYFYYSPLTPPITDEEFINIDVNVVWNDNNNADLNRPDNIIVKLFADGTEVDTHELSGTEDWNYTFIECPKYQPDGTEIIYTVNCDPIEWYMPQIDDFIITNVYQPEVTSYSVRKIWNDNNNANNDMMNLDE